MRLHSAPCHTPLSTHCPLCAVLCCLHGACFLMQGVTYLSIIVALASAALPIYAWWVV